MIENFIDSDSFNVYYLSQFALYNALPNSYNTRTFVAYNTNLLHMQSVYNGTQFNVFIINRNLYLFPTQISILSINCFMSLSTSARK